MQEHNFKIIVFYTTETYGSEFGTYDTFSSAWGAACVLTGEDNVACIVVREECVFVRNDSTEISSNGPLFRWCPLDGWKSCMRDEMKVEV